MSTPVQVTNVQVTSDSVYASGSQPL